VVIRGRPVLRLTGHEAKAIESALDKFMRMTLIKPEGMAKRNQECRIELLKQLNKSGLIEFRGDKVLVTPGTWRFSFPPYILLHMAKACLNSHERGWDKGEIVVAALEKINRAIKALKC